MDEFEKLYTVEDIAKMTSLTSRTIRNYLKDGSLQGKKIGGQWRFTMDDIKRLFESSSLSKDMIDHTKQELLDFIDGVIVKMRLSKSVTDWFLLLTNKKQRTHKLDFIINTLRRKAKRDLSYMAYRITL